MHTQSQTIIDVAAAALAHPMYGDMILLLIWFGAAAAVGMAWNSWQEARRSRPVTFNRRLFRSSKRHALR